HPDAIALVPLRQCQDPRTQLDIAVGPWCIAIRAGAHPHRRQRPPFTQSPHDHLSHHVAPDGCGHGFFRRTSLITSFSNICSASSFFSRAFSASSSFSRFASDTLIPPALPR